MENKLKAGTKKNKFWRAIKREKTYGHGNHQKQTRTFVVPRKKPLIVDVSSHAVLTNAFTMITQ